MPNQLPVACFAPPLTDELLARYTDLIQGISPIYTETKEAMLECLVCVKAWWSLPESLRNDGPQIPVKYHGKNISIHIIPLENDHIQSLWDVTPWMRELTAMKPLFDSIHIDMELRNAAFHLLWHCKEITLDREPITHDHLPGL